MGNFAFESGDQGSIVQFTAAADLTAGEAVIDGSLFGVATHAVSSGDLGSLAVDGIWKCPKTGGGGITFSVGDHVYYDVAPGQLVTSDADAGANIHIGLAVEAAVNADTTVLVRLQPLAA